MDFPDIMVPEVKRHDPEIEVLRVLVPGLMPMTFGYGYEPLFRF